MKAFSDTSPAAHAYDIGMNSAAMLRASFSVFPDTSGRNGINQASKRKRPSRRTKGIGL